MRHGLKVAQPGGIRKASNVESCDFLDGCSWNHRMLALPWLFIVYVIVMMTMTVTIE